MLKLHNAHPIHKPKRHKVPHELLFLDTETIENYETDTTRQLTFKSGCMIFVRLSDDLSITEREIFYLYSIADFYDYLDKITESCKSLIIFAHNIGFDLRVIEAFHRLAEYGWKSSPPIINNRLFIWQAKHGKHTLDFIDTANLGVSTVEELGRIIGKPKLSIDFNIASITELEIYCLRDCEIIEEFIIEYLRFIKYYDLGGFRKTIASQALHTFLYRFYDDNIYPHRLPKVLELEQAAYFGGRTEAFHIGELPDDTYAMLDINSMYASILLSCKMPNNLKAFREGKQIRKNPIPTEDSYIIADCLLKTDTNAFPLIADNKLCFYTGRFRACLHDAEYRYALNNGYIIKVFRYAEYSALVLFEDYARFFLNERAKHKASGNTIWDDICKKFNNSLYGKFAQHGYRRKKIDTISDKRFGRLPYFDHTTQTAGQFITWDGNVINEYKKGLANHSCIAIAGAVTAYGRMMLFQLGQIAGNKNWFYCDTDSLIVNCKGACNLLSFIDNKKTGALKLVKLSTHVHIYGAKDYKFGNIVRIKGIKENAIRLADNSFEQWQFQSVLAWLNAGGAGTIKITKVVKHRKTSYKKGIVNVDGSVSPIQLY